MKRTLALTNLTKPAMIPCMEALSSLCIYLFFRGCNLNKSDNTKTKDHNGRF